MYLIKCKCDTLHKEHFKNRIKYEIFWLCYGNILGVPPVTNSAVFLNIVQKGGGVKPMFKNFGADFA